MIVTEEFRLDDYYMPGHDEEWRGMYGLIPDMIAEDARELTFWCSQKEGLSAQELTTTLVSVGVASVGEHLAEGLGARTRGEIRSSLQNMLLEERVIDIARSQPCFETALQDALLTPVKEKKAFGYTQSAQNVTAIGLRAAWTDQVNDLAFSKEVPEDLRGDDLDTNLVEGKGLVTALSRFLSEAGVLPDVYIPDTERELFEEFMKRRKRAVLKAQASENPEWRNR